MPPSRSSGQRRSRGGANEADPEEDAWLETCGLDDEELVQWEDQAVFEGYTYAHNDLTEVLEGVEEEVDEEPAEEEDNEDEIVMTP
jgi:hypothetical protein